jgi:hypothetical protein
MPHKYNAARRHHIPQPKRRVTNWSAYNEALRQRGSLTVWFTEDAIAAWKAAQRTTPGGQPHYSDLAITTALTLRAVFHLALRQTEGLIGSVLQLLSLDLSVPDFSTLSRRAQSLELPAQPRATGGAIHLLVDSTLSDGCVIYRPAPCLRCSPAGPTLLLQFSAAAQQGDHVDQFPS